MFSAPCLPRNRPGRHRRIAAAVAELPPADVRAENLWAVLAQATPDELEAGRDWYSQAGQLAETVAKIADVPVSHGAGIIAALSPQCAWERNVELALTFAAEGDCSHLCGDAIRKARAIRNGAHPSTVLGGRKVRSFFHNISGHESHVTVDRHAASIVAGRSFTDRELKVLERIGPYQAIAATYRGVARQAGLTPATLQAVVWVVWRRLKGLDDTAAF